MEEEAEARLSGRRVTGMFSCRKKIKVSGTQKIKIPSDQTPLHLFTFDE